MYIWCHYNTNYCTSHDFVPTTVTRPAKPNGTAAVRVELYAFYDPFISLVYNNNILPCVIRFDRINV